VKVNYFIFWRKRKPIHCPQGESISFTAMNPGHDIKLHPAVIHLLSSLCGELVAMPTTRWEFRIVPCIAGGNASATCLKMLVMRFADVQ